MVCVHTDTAVCICFRYGGGREAEEHVPRRLDGHLADPLREGVRNEVCEKLLRVGRLFRYYHQFETLILNILLYGADSWSTTEAMRQRLRVFHARCVRGMCRVSRKHTWAHHISTAELERRLGVDSIVH